MSFRYFKHWLRFSSIRSIIVLALISIPNLCSASAQTTTKGGIDWILVVDTSASMRGVGGTKNIFEPVKNSITEFVNTARLGDTVTIYSFDKDVTLNANDITINSNPDRGKLKQIISSLKADGVRTHTGKAVQKALQHSALLNKRADALGRTVSIVFLTDGLEDVRGIPNPVSIPGNTQFLSEQQCKPYIFFVSLGLKEHEKQLNDFASNPALCGKGQVLRDPGGVQLNQLAQNIRPALIKPKLDVNLPTANLPPVLPGATTEPLKINSISNVNAKVSLQLEDPQQSGIRLISPDRTIDLVANQATAIPVRLQIPAEAKGGANNLRLVLISADQAIAPIKIDLPVTIQSQLQIEPTKIDFGSIEAGKTTETQIFIVRTNISGTASLQLQGNSKDVSIAEPSAAISLQPGETKIPVQLQVTDSSFAGDRTFTLALTPDNSIASPVSAKAHLYILMPLWRKIVIWLLLVLLVLLISLIVVCLIQRKTPLELVEDFRNRDRLEGALVVLEPLPQSSQDEEISLTHLQKGRVCLSDLIPAIAMTNSDAELVIVWRLGKKNIDIRCLKGVIFVNTKKINTDELYDEDIIEIGNVKLQFNWIEHQRPSEPSSGQTNF
ncbi:vWA domain-containing protein [Nostoc sp. 'Lobaria pulmonaria (5183) cyanobiont']|uniref:vWA domain-containing protein n=1 Tax=Nostoc sp. 'Lobaria pulmonaria (5183) cyanobiont' TaxID=1618022 RepID=UPI000CF32ADD|nr:vWA domain-containing protein [Nostoc sp. 'Lobaria pulmonaria (5183) cyanobiont']AVH73987.1 von Willebrand factor type A domain-containing protein [Nostoc sp. 'Lobaria pulmonaria (5183) cyanobiont']